jgi:hypothetical protein
MFCLVDKTYNKKMKTLSKLFSIGALMLTLGLQGSEYLVPAKYNAHGKVTYATKTVSGGINNGHLITSRYRFDGTYISEPYATGFMYFYAQENVWADSDKDYAVFLSVTDPTSIVKKEWMAFGNMGADGTLLQPVNWIWRRTQKNGIVLMNFFNGWPFGEGGLTIPFPSASVGLTSSLKNVNQQANGTYYGPTGLAIQAPISDVSSTFNSLTFNIVLDNTMGPFINGNNYLLKYQYNYSGNWITSYETTVPCPQPWLQCISVSLPLPSLPPLYQTATFTGTAREIAIIP